MKTKLTITREGPIKIGVKDIERVWRARAKDARRVVVDSERPGLSLITNATSQTWSYSYKPRGVDPENGKRFHTRSMTIGSPATHSPHEARVAANRIRGEVAAAGTLRRSARSRSPRRRQNAPPLWGRRSRTISRSCP